MKVTLFLMIFSFFVGSSEINTNRVSTNNYFSILHDDAYQILDSENDFPADNFLILFSGNTESIDEDKEYGVVEVQSDGKTLDSVFLPGAELKKRLLDEKPIIAWVLV